MSKHFVDDSDTLIDTNDEILASRNANLNDINAPALSPKFNRLSFIDFTLTNVDFSNCALITSTFVRTRLENCSFVGADLRNSNLNESEFINCNVLNARLLNDVYAISVVSRRFDPETGISGFHVFDTTAGVVVFIHSKFYTVDALTTHLYTIFGKPRADEYLLAVNTLAVDTYGETCWK